MYKINRLQWALGCLLSFLPLPQVPLFMLYFMHTNNADSRRYTRGWTAPCHLLTAQSDFKYRPKASYCPCRRSWCYLCIGRYSFFICVVATTLYRISHICVLDTLGSEASLASQLSVFLHMRPHCLFCSLTWKTWDYHEGVMVRIHVWLLIAKVISFGMKRYLSLVTVGNDRLSLWHWSLEPFWWKGVAIWISHAGIGKFSMRQTWEKKQISKTFR